MKHNQHNQTELTYNQIQSNSQTQANRIKST